jgi:hypothetical protein
LAAAYTYERQRLDVRRAAALARAERDAEALSDFTHLPEAVTCRWRVFRFAGREDAAVDELRRASTQTDNVGVTYAFAVNLYRRGSKTDLEEADGRLQRWRDTFLPAYLRCFVIAELQNGPMRALEAYRGVAALELDGWNRIRSTSLLHFLGRAAEARSVAQGYLRAGLALPPLRRPMQERVLNYFAGNLSEARFLEGVTASRWDQTMTYHFAGLARLADGDRAGAREYFGRALAPQVFTITVYDITRVLFNRLERDKRWPPWIPVAE